jgi:iron-sulfur cluster assembly protein
MLTLTDNAATIVKSIAEQPETAGLRITSDGSPESAFGVSTASGPQADDQVVEQDGATVYLDPNAAQQLDDKILDAGVDEAGNLQFALGQQA